MEADDAKHLAGAMSFEPRLCLNCGTGLTLETALEDGGPKARLRCAACGWTHWNYPTPVRVAVIECSDRDGLILVARNAAWPGRMFALITGFMEAGGHPLLASRHRLCHGRLAAFAGE